jgi:pilus assembly protein CpaE
MNHLSQDMVGMSRVDLEALDGLRVPRIGIVAFCETQAAADTITAAAADRRMARATVDVRAGGISGAIEFYREAPSPDLLILESQSSCADLLEALEGLADVSEPETNVLVVGESNDIMLYRELMDRGIADYVVGPLSEPSIIAAIGRIYRDREPKKLGRTCAFIGAKGGTGASTVAHNVAWTLGAELASGVVLADMDLPFGTAGLDFNIDTEQGIAEAIDDSGRLDELLLDRLLVPCNDHLSLLAAPAALGKSYDLDETAFEQMLEVARAHVPTVVLDVPHVWTAWARRTLVSADNVVIVAEPDLANLRNAKGLVEFLKQARPNDAPPKLVLNKVGMPKRPEIKPADFAKALALEPSASIAFNPALFGAAANKGQMIADVAARSPAYGAFVELAHAVGGRSDLKAPRKSTLGAKLVAILTGRKRPAPAVSKSSAKR